MNRAERRRQAKVQRRQSPHQSPAPLPTVATMKATLQQFASPTEVQQYIATLVSRGLPSAAGDELRVYAAQFHAATDILHQTDRPATDRLTSLVTSAHVWADTTIDQSRQTAQRACHAGCAWCCYLPVILVTAAEAIYLAQWLHRHCSEVQTQALLQRLSQRLQKKQAAADQQRDEPPLACPLLQNNQCMAYAARPLKCRGWNSLRLADCEQAYGHSPSSPQVPIDSHAFVMGNAVLNGLSDSVSKAGLDGTNAELCQALLQALTQPDIAERWQKGEKIFSTLKKTSAKHE